MGAARRRGSARCCAGRALLGAAQQGQPARIPPVPPRMRGNAGVRQRHVPGADLYLHVGTRLSPLYRLRADGHRQHRRLAVRACRQLLQRRHLRSGAILCQRPVSTHSWCMPRRRRLCVGQDMRHGNGHMPQRISEFLIVIVVAVSIKSYAADNHRACPASLFYCEKEKEKSVYMQKEKRCHATGSTSRRSASTPE